MNNSREDTQKSYILNEIRGMIDIVNPETPIEMLRQIKEEVGKHTVDDEKERYKLLNYLVDKSESGTLKNLFKRIDNHVNSLEPDDTSQSATLSPALSAKEIFYTEYLPIKFIIPDMLTEGVSILAGAPKIGKSWLCLNIAISVANGGIALSHRQVLKRNVHYFALEDNGPRIKDRLQTTLYTEVETPPDNLFFDFNCPKLSSGGIETIKKRIEENNIELVIIDTLAKMKHPMLSKNVYSEDYAVMDIFKQLYDKTRASFLIVTHTRKAPDEDIINKVTSSTGTTGSADSILILEKKRGKTDGELHIIGRDLKADIELALKKDDKGNWAVLGNAEEYRLSQEKQSVLDALKDTDEPMTPKEVAKLLDKNRESINRTLRDLCKDGYVEKTGYGKYRTQE